MQTSQKELKLRIGSKLVAEKIEPLTGAITTPIYQTTSFAFPVGEKYRYSRELNPTVERLNELVASIELGERGISFSSGMGAISTTVLSLIKPGDLVSLQMDIFGRTLRFFTDFLSKWGVKVKVVETGTLPTDIIAKPNFVFVETITNPLLRVPDLERLCAESKENGITLIVDNTFATPINLNPLMYCNAIVVHSGSKFLIGHNDVIAGFVIGSGNAMNSIDLLRRTLGTSIDPHAAYMAIRGIKTLKVRMDAINQNSLALAEFLEDHPKVSKVIYPGLSSHPDYKRARRLLRGYGGVISFEVKGTGNDAISVMKKGNLIIPAQTLGGVNSVISHPATMSHRSLTAEERKKIGLTDTLLRLSVGIEDVEDLKEELDRMLSDSG
ncbi:hypothetical protein HS7_16730 [Sulfolobales archaeon HS-7]|nr:hypothetical protein HS7_16730 [Sulfolobales archaeon HS-7]